MAYPNDSVDACAREGADVGEPVRVPRWATIVAAVVVLVLGAGIGLTVRESNRRADATRCVSNLKQIGQAILLYSNVNRNRYPDTFATLARRSLHELPAGLATFVCPASDDAAPADAEAADHGSYRLTGDSMPERMKMFSGQGFKIRGDWSAGECVAIELPGHHAGGVHVLLDDGSVHFRTIAATRGETWADVQDDVTKGSPIRWPASQPWR